MRVILIMSSVLIILNVFQLRKDDSHQARATERYLHTERRAPAEHRECLQSGQEEKELFSVCHRWAVSEHRGVLGTPSVLRAIPFFKKCFHCFCGC